MDAEEVLAPEELAVRAGLDDEGLLDGGTPMVVVDLRRGDPHTLAEAPVGSLPVVVVGVGGACTVRLSGQGSVYLFSLVSPSRYISYVPGGTLVVVAIVNVREVRVPIGPNKSEMVIPNPSGMPIMKIYDARGEPNRVTETVALADAPAVTVTSSTKKFTTR